VRAAILNPPRVSASRRRARPASGTGRPGRKGDQQRHWGSGALPRPRPARRVSAERAEPPNAQNHRPLARTGHGAAIAVGTLRLPAPAGWSHTSVATVPHTSAVSCAPPNGLATRDHERPCRAATVTAVAAGTVRAAAALQHRHTAAAPLCSTAGGHRHAHSAALRGGSERYKTSGG